MEDLELNRSDLLDVLNEMNIVIPTDTKLKQDRLRHRLGRALDAAQRYSHLFSNEPPRVNPTDYPTWDMKKDVAEALYRKVWGGLLGDSENKRGAFAKVCLFIVALGEGWKQGVENVIFTDEKSTAIAIRVCSIHAASEKRPVVVVGYACLSSTRKMSLQQAMLRFWPAGTKHNRFKSSKVEQAMFLFLLMHNSKHLSTDFQPPHGLNEIYDFSFLLPTTWLSMDDIGRLNKTTGCVVCGENTRSTCSACQSVQYCGKGENVSSAYIDYMLTTSVECQRMHWGDHKLLCRSIASGAWYTVTLEPHPLAELSGLSSISINRYDDWEERSSIHGSESRNQVPTNIHGDNYHIVKLQLPMGRMDHMYLYDREKSFQAFLRQDKNPGAFLQLAIEMGNWPKLYRWAKRVGGWEWKICVNRGPQPEPRW